MPAIHWVAWLGETYLLASRMEDALTCALRALELSHAHKERGHQAWALRLLGDIAMHRNPPDFEQAKTHYQQALVLANELGMRPLQAIATVALAPCMVRQDSRAMLVPNCPVD